VSYSRGGGDVEVRLGFGDCSRKERWITEGGGQNTPLRCRDGVFAEGPGFAMVARRVECWRACSEIRCMQPELPLVGAVDSWQR